MMTQIRPVDPESLIPPLLDCLQHSAEFTPPAKLLPLLTPILQQRCNLLSSQSGSWLLLLNWNRDLAKKLPDAVQSADFHLDYQDNGRVCYRRLDPETIMARVEVRDYQLLPTYLWCMANEQNAARGTWKLHELRCLEDEDEMSKWSYSLQEAEATFRASSTSSVKTNGTSATVMPYEANSNNHTDDEDDGSYWASYDMTPGQSGGRTPAKMSPAPSFLHGGVPNRVPSRTATNEAEYFNRYMDIQPALDPYDPEEDTAKPTTNPLVNHGRRMVDLQTTSSTNHQNSHVNGKSYDEDEDMMDKDENENENEEEEMENHRRTLSLRQPRPHSSSSSSSHAQASPRSIARLEEVAENQAQAEMGIKQHISTDIKSLYRLAKSAGISREEFVRIVKRELDVLPLLDME